jgi:hypothetical protein
MRKKILGIPVACLRCMSATLALLIITELAWPTAAYALTGGPSQPEVHGFTPIGTSEMVNVFTGDFNYNIPLLDVDGYPVNISYQSGVGMEDEASWVGLGWSLNVGTINRAMRGLPDEFKGDEVKTKLNMRPSRTYGLKGTITPEIWGMNLENSQLSGDFGAGFNFNNYNGFGFEKSVSMTFNTGKNGKGPFEMGLGLNSDTNNGLSIQPSASLVGREDGKKNTPLFSSLGASYSTRGGFSELTLSVTPNVTAPKTRVNQLLGQQLSASFDLGMPTYTPSVNVRMKNVSASARFTVGAAFFGTHPLIGINAYYSSQQLKENELSNPAYGYFYTGYGQNEEDALHDFNREKDGPFMPKTPVLPVANYTYDVFSVSGQGAGGSFRPFRGDVPHMYDADSGTESEGYSGGLELGVGLTSHNGANILVNSVSNKSGKWVDDNNAKDVFKGRIEQSGAFHEPFYFREANEMGVSSDPDWINRMGGFEAAEFVVSEPENFNTRLTSRLSTSEESELQVNSTRKALREHRNALLTRLTNEEVIGGLGYKGTNYGSIGYDSNVPDHYTAEFTALGNDGSRYVYAIPALNHKTVETTFAIGGTINNAQDGLQPVCNTNGVNVLYSGDDKTLDNERGLDNYFSETETPAYAHSYLLSAILSQDYIDSDNIGGPSPGDFGTYTVFEYEKMPTSYKWRSPVHSFSAQYQEGVRVDIRDDKANVIYGEKEIWFLTQIQTKNYVAQFILSPRSDARPVIGPDGGVSFSNDNPMHKLDRIELYTRAGFIANEAPIKTIRFEYDYSLCPGLPNSGVQGPGGGKLTLKAIYMTYEKSDMGAINPYRFVYSTSYQGGTFAYDRRDMDRWGNFKPDPSITCDDLFGPLPNSSFPYCTQSEATDEYASSWLLERIVLPSGGEIEVQYESDDYAFVQNKKAMQMVPIIGVVNPWIVGDPPPPPIPVAATAQGGVVPFEDGSLFLFDLNSFGHGDFLGGIGDVIYMRCEVNIPPTNSYPNTYHEFESIPIYGEIEDKGEISVVLNQGEDPEPCGFVKLKGVHPKTVDPGNMSPITKAAIQFGRLHAPQQIYSENGALPDLGEGSLTLQFFESLVSFVFQTDLLAIFQDLNTNRKNKGCGRYLTLNRSFMRVFNPDGHKRGGGARVKSVLIHDNWQEMSNSSAMSRTFGQTYTYELSDGRSSGVAAYEPLIGGDENPFRRPLPFELDNMLAPDEVHFIETPVGESFFPSPQVGYSRVEIRDYAPEGDAGNGMVVQEFYTARDFPTIAERTSLAHPIRQRTSPFNILSLLSINSKDYMTASQGFVIETNDMHGKQRAQYVYAEGVNDAAISSVVYEYSSEPYNGAMRLKNEAKVIAPDGTISTGLIGVHFDVVADFRESTSTVEGIGVESNLDVTTLPLIPPVPFLFPSLIPSYNAEKTRFRSATLTKVIQRFGILKRTIATDNTSEVSTRNLAYDAVTGQVLATETFNNFDDEVYNLTYPVHWHYDQMGPAYSNVGITMSLSFNSGGYAPLANADNYYVEGDVIGSLNYGLGWVTGVTNQGITVQRKNGSPFVGNHLVKTIQSGRKNMSTQSMAQITTLADPMEYFTANVFEKVIQASAIEYSDEWSTYCDCFSKDGLNFTSSNPYILGSKGNWKPVRSYAYLAGRDQSYYNYNTNIQKDGIFTSFNPFYKLNNNKWVTDKSNWTFASEVTEFSPFGQEIENRDALGRYSAAQFGYKGLLPVAVAANSRYFQMGFNNFEDYDPLGCGQSLRFKGGSIAEVAHTGNKSIRVAQGHKATHLIKSTAWKDCDPVDCALELRVSTGNSRLIHVTNASGQISFDYNILYGSPNVQLIAANELQFTGSGYQAIVTITDSAGCTSVYNLQN